MCLTLQGRKSQPSCSFLLTDVFIMSFLILFNNSKVMDSFFGYDVKESLGNVWCSSFDGGKQKDTAFHICSTVLMPHLN
jgi:hypothetical protein